MGNVEEIIKKIKLAKDDKMEKAAIRELRKLPKEERVYAIRALLEWWRRCWFIENRTEVIESTISEIGEIGLPKLAEGISKWIGEKKKIKPEASEDFFLGAVGKGIYVDCWVAFALRYYPGERTKKALLKMMPDGCMRLFASVKSLAMRGETECIEKTLREASWLYNIDVNDDLGKRYFEALKPFGEEAYKKAHALIRSERSPNHVKRACIDVLTRANYVKALPDIEKLLEDMSFTDLVKVAVLKLKGRDAWPMTVKILSEYNGSTVSERLCRKAVDNFVKHPAEEALDALIALANRKPQRADKWKEVVKAIMSLPPEKAVEGLLQLNPEDAYEQDGSKKVYEAALKKYPEVMVRVLHEMWGASKIEREKAGYVLSIIRKELDSRSGRVGIQEQPEDVRQALWPPTLAGRDVGRVSSVNLSRMAVRF